MNNQTFSPASEIVFSFLTLIRLADYQIKDFIVVLPEDCIHLRNRIHSGLSSDDSPLERRTENWKKTDRTPKPVNQWEKALSGIRISKKGDHTCQCCVIHTQGTNGNRNNVNFGQPGAFAMLVSNRS